MRYILLYSILLFTGLFTGIQATETDSLALEYPYINYTTKDGLPSNETYCIFQDSRGYIWIGTDRGLVKYDGYEFKTYTTLDGLTDNVILAVKEDDKGNIWYTGLNSHQLGYIDPEMKFRKYKHYNELIEEFIGRNHLNIHFNELYFHNENIYLVNKLYGYIILDDKGVKEINIRDNNDNYTGSRTLMYNQNKVHFVFSDYLGLDYFDFNVDIINANGNKIYSYVASKSRNVFPTLLSKNSIDYIYNSEYKLVINNAHVEHEKLPYLCSAFQLDQDQFLFSTYSEGELQKTVYYSNSPDINDPKIKLKDGIRISSAIKDSRGGVWITSLRKGILYIPNFNSKITNADDPVETLYPLQNQLILISKNTEYLYELNSDKIYKSALNLNYSQLNGKPNKFSFFGGFRVDVDLKSIGKNFDHQYLKGIQILSDSLLYGWRTGYLFKIKKGKIYYNELWKSNNYNMPYQGSLYCFKEDSCLYGTRKGFYLFHGDSIVNLEDEENKYIRQIDYFKRKEILVYSIWGEGLVVKFKDGNRKRITTKEGLVSNTINVVYMDSAEVLWIGSNKGVNTLKIDSNNQVQIETIIKASKSLSSPNILQLYVEDSLLYLGTDAGFNIVNLKVKDLQKIPLHINRIEVNNTVYNSSPKQFTLPYDSNSILINYTAIAFNMYGEINYRYRLDGLSKEWIYTKETKSIFSQVNPGKYTFNLQVQNEYGEWLSLKENPKFIILKPYWKTWWFIGGIALSIVVIIGSALYYYISNLKKEKTFIEDKQQLSEELNESRQKALSAQLNPHFVFNSLNSIQNFILTKRTELSSDYLSTFSKLMRFVFENSKKLYVPLSDEIEALGLYLELEQVRHNHKFKFFIKSNELSTTSIFLPSLLIQPIIENAIWHGLLHKQGDNRLLEVSFSKKNNRLRIEIKDNGVGRGSSNSRPKFIKKQRSSGVELTKQRLVLLSQSLESETNFEVIDLFDKENKASGTLVIITIPILLEGEGLS